MKTFFQKIFPHLLKGKVAVNCPLSNLMTVKGIWVTSFSYSSNHSLTLHALWMGFWKSHQHQDVSSNGDHGWSRWRTFHLLSVPHHLRGQVNPKQPLHSWSPRSYWRVQHSGFLFNLLSDRPDLTKKPEVKKEQAASQLLFNTVFHSTQMWNNTHRVWFLNAHHLII